MLRVYLDQNKWIDLSRAVHGRAGGERHADVLDLLRFATQQGLVSLPLSMSHYFEKWKRGDPQSRQRLGTVMCELSMLYTIAGPATVTPHEIDMACHLIAGRPFQRPVLQVFGRGVGHACGTTPVGYTPPEGLDPALAWQLRQIGTEVMERVPLITPPFQLPVRGIARPTDEFGERYAESERASRERLEEEGFSNNVVRRFVFASELTDIVEALVKTLNRSGLALTDVMHDEESAASFLEAMPSRWATAHLRRVAFQNRSNKWDAHDLNDMAYLSIAFMYCDIVVTERKWANYVAA
jgi:hypothetical protein